MSDYHISPEYCLILKALRETASMREAALRLNTDPAQLTRKIQKLSHEHDVIYKVGNRWALTEAGLRLATWADESIQSQKAILQEKKTIRIAAFTWLAEEMLIPGMTKLMKDIPDTSFVFSLNARDLEGELSSGRADYVITCHPPNDPQIAHKVFNEDPWFIVVPMSWKEKLKGHDVREFLKTRPFIRITTLEPENTLGFSPQLISDVMVDGVIGARSAVANGLGWSCLPGFALQSLLKEKSLLKLPIESETKGKLSLWWVRRRGDHMGHGRQLSKWLKEISA